LAQSLVAVPADSTVAETLNSQLFASLRPQVPKLQGRFARALDLGSGERTVFDYLSAREMVCTDIVAVPECAKRFRFVVCRAEKLAFRNDCFDVVVARVAIPYVNLPEALPEIYRVLAHGGRLWATLHLPRMALRRMLKAAGKGDVKDVVYQLYALLNYFLTCEFSYQLKWFNGRYESVQTPSSIRRALRRAGFVDVKTEIIPDTHGRGKHFAVEAVKR
jgi:ubiquinone/menaquinone biosynthesis C-methylase UbiE